MGWCILVISGAACPHVKMSDLIQFLMKIFVRLVEVLCLQDLTSICHKVMNLQIRKELPHFQTHSPQTTRFGKLF